MTLLSAATGQLSFARQALLVLGGSIFIAAAAQVSVPMYPVPMTLQTLAILIVGLSYGARLATLTLLAYLAEGAAGLPVFANAGTGAAFFGPTAGFLVGFVGVAALVGFAADRGWTRHVGLSALVCVLASAVLYLPGVAWPLGVANALGLAGGWTALGTGQVWQYFVGPFLLGDIVKSVLAALIVSGAFVALRNSKA
jgi:biotin transport system substrate-specific component